MLDINKPFRELVESKGTLYVADKLGHKMKDNEHIVSTLIVERWFKSPTGVPDGKKFQVFELLRAEGVIR